MFGEVPVAVVAGEFDGGLVVAFFVDLGFGDAEDVGLARVDVGVEGLFVDDGAYAVDVPVPEHDVGRGGSVSPFPTVGAGFVFSDSVQQFFFEDLVPALGGGLGFLLPGLFGFLFFLPGSWLSVILAGLFFGQHMCASKSLTQSI